MRPSLGGVVVGAQQQQDAPHSHRQPPMVAQCTRWTAARRSPGQMPGWHVLGFMSGDQLLWTEALQVPILEVLHMIPSLESFNWFMS